MAQATVVGGTGWNSGKRKVDAIDLADGAYELFGRQHNMMFGGSYSKQNNRYFSAPGERLSGRHWQLQRLLTVISPTSCHAPG